MKDKERIAGIRFAGLICLLLGGGFTYFSLAQVLHQAASGAPRLLAGNTSVAGPPLLLTGLVCLIFSRQTLFHIAAGRRGRSKFVWVFIAVFALMGLGFSMWLEARLRSFGYSRSFA